MGLFQVLCLGFVLCQDFFYPASQPTQIITLPMGFLNLIQPLKNGLELLIPAQASPCERFSTAAIDGISNGTADLGFNPS